MNRRIRLRTLTATLAVTLAAGLASTACGNDRWCEHDATDTTVDNSFCEKNTPGYEWEPDSDGKSKSKSKTKSKKTTTSKKKP